MPAFASEIPRLSIFRSIIRRALSHPSHRFRRHSVYLLYWYKSTNTDAAGFQNCAQYSKLKKRTKRRTIATTSLLASMCLCAREWADSLSVSSSIRSCNRIRSCIRKRQSQIPRIRACSSTLGEKSAYRSRRLQTQPAFLL